MVKVKICGIREVEHALVASQTGADFVGLIFAESKRQITPKKAKEIVDSVRRLKEHPLTVGLFVNTPASEVNRIARECGLDVVQLSGDETWEYCLDIEKPVIKAVHVSDYENSQAIIHYLKSGQIMLGDRFPPLLDSGGKGTYGGTGEVFDWEVAREISSRFNVILAGGLTPENVGKAIRLVRPWGVDVSSGVETGGKKDSLRIKAFIDAVKKTD